MTLRQRRRPPVEINIAPLLDVVFLLLIFFMVSTTFKEETRLQLQLPTAAGDPVTTPPTVIRISIDHNGQFFVNDQSVTSQQALPQTLLTLVNAATAPPPVVIQADAHTPHQAVITALEAARHAGLSRIAFAATAPDHPAP